jgi:hypothetical protein
LRICLEEPRVQNVSLIGKPIVHCSLEVHKHIYHLVLYHDKAHQISCLRSKESRYIYGRPRKSDVFKYALTSMISFVITDRYKQSHIDRKDGPGLQYAIYCLKAVEAQSTCTRIDGGKRTPIVLWKYVTPPSNVSNYSLRGHKRASPSPRDEV